MRPISEPPLSTPVQTVQTSVQTWNEQRRACPDRPNLLTCARIGERVSSILLYIHLGLDGLDGLDKLITARVLLSRPLHPRLDGLDSRAVGRDFCGCSPWRAAVKGSSVGVCTAGNSDPVLRACPGSRFWFR